MKIAVTISGYRQVGINVFRDWHRTMVFNSTASIDDMMAWAKTVDENVEFSGLLLSEVDEKSGQSKE